VRAKKPLSVGGGGEKTPSIRTVKLVIGFDGTRYEGWQSQKKGKTLQELFEKILEKILSEKTSLISSSRTDSGVHALGLVAHLKTKNRLPDQKLKDALNFYLPRDVVVFSAKTVKDGFHARYSAKSKLYRYDILTGSTRPLFEASRVLWHPRPLNVKDMRLAARHFIGKHDFCAFRNGDDEQKSTVRTVKRLTIHQSGGLVRIAIEADGFLRNMVRVIVGTLMDVGLRRLEPSSIPGILDSKNRKKAGPTAKAHGLTLMKVTY